MNKKELFANVELNEETMQKVIAQLVVENADMQRKIEEAIKFIENYDWYYLELKKTLLDILKGDIEEQE